MGITTNQITDTLTPSTGTLNVGGAILPTTALAATAGGTAQSTYTTGDTLYASASNTLSKLPIGTSGQVLTVAGGIPSWATPSSGAYSGVAMTSVVNLTNTTETYLTPAYSPPSIVSGSVFKFECAVKVGSGIVATCTIRVRIGSAGTTSDTQVFLTSATSSTSEIPIKIVGTIVFDSTTSVFRVSAVESNSLTGSYTSGQSPIDVIEDGPNTGLTPTYIGLTAQASAGSALQYLQVYEAMIYRIL